MNVSPFIPQTYDAFFVTPKYRSLATLVWRLKVILRCGPITLVSTRPIHILTYNSDWVQKRMFGWFVAHQSRYIWVPDSSRWSMCGTILTTRTMSNGGGNRDGRSSRYYFIHFLFEYWTNDAFRALLCSILTSWYRTFISTTLRWL